MPRSDRNESTVFFSSVASPGLFGRLLASAGRGPELTRAGQIPGRRRPEAGVMGVSPMGRGCRRPGYHLPSVAVGPSLIAPPFSFTAAVAVAVDRLGTGPNTRWVDPDDPRRGASPTEPTLGRTMAAGPRCRRVGQEVRRRPLSEQSFATYRSETAGLYSYPDMTCPNPLWWPRQPSKHSGKAAARAAAGIRHLLGLEPATSPSGDAVT